MWKKLGVNVELVQTEIKVNSANLRQGDFDVGHVGWTADYNDAHEFLDTWQTSTQQNYARFSNSDYDRLMDDASVTSDPDKRAQLLAQAERVCSRKCRSCRSTFGSPGTWSARGSRAGRTICSISPM